MKTHLKSLFVFTILIASISILSSCVSCVENKADTFFDDEYKSYKSDDELEKIRQKKQSWYNNLDEEEKQKALKEKEKQETKFLNGIFGID